MTKPMTIDDTCFFCDHYYHSDPDTDCCDIDDHEVYFDTPRCKMFGSADSDKRPVLGLLRGDSKPKPLSEVANSTEKLPEFLDAT